MSIQPSFLIRGLVGMKSVRGVLCAAPCKCSSVPSGERVAGTRGGGIRCLLVLLSLLLLPTIHAYGQDKYVTSDYYNYNVGYSTGLYTDNTYADYGTSYISTNTITVAHKEGKYSGSFKHSAAGGDYDDDTFTKGVLDSDGLWENEFGMPMQRCHTYYDTLYVHKGDSLYLFLPFIDQYENDQKQYYRWYNYVTDSNFYVNSKVYDTNGNITGGICDLLTPTVGFNADDGEAGWATSGNTPFARYANGYCSGRAVDGLAQKEDYFWRKDGVAFGYCGYAMSKAAFYYPTDEEYSNNSISGMSAGEDNSYYVVACDYSDHTDFLFNSYDETYQDAYYKDTRHYHFGGKPTYNPGGQNAENTQTGTISAESFCEPTLLGRCVWVIIGVDDVDDTSASSSSLPARAQEYLSTIKTCTGDDGPFLEEYDYIFPTRHIAVMSDEVVGIAHEARGYMIPGVSASDDTKKLDVKIETDLPLEITSKFKASEASEASPAINWRDKGIKFNHTKATRQDVNPYGVADSWKVDEGTATITVTKTVDGTTYNIAKINITFSDKANLLTSPQVYSLAHLGESGTWTNPNGNTGEYDYTNYSDWWWKGMGYRTPENIRSKYTEVAGARLSFNYDPANGIGNMTLDTDTISGFYAFPMNWDYTGYGFADGEAFNGIDDLGDRDVHAVRAAQYALMNDYHGWEDLERHKTDGSVDDGSVDDGSVKETVKVYPETNCPTARDGGSYFLYMDGTMTPGTFATLPINESLCAGTELCFTCWVKGANSGPYQDSFNNNEARRRHDSSLIFQLVGIDNTGEHPLKSFSTGQFSRTTYMSNVFTDGGEKDNEQTYTGKGWDTNEWLQVFFSYTFDSEVEYDSYALRLQNFCVSSNGADCYFDGMRVYIAHPEATVMQLSQACNGDYIVNSQDDDSGESVSDYDYESSTYSEYPLLRIDLDYEHMMANCGLVEGDDDNNPTSQSVDWIILDEAKFNHYLDGLGTTLAEASEDVKTAAIDYSLVSIYDANGESTVDPIFTFNPKFLSNEKYSTETIYEIDQKNGMMYRYVYNGEDITDKFDDNGEVTAGNEKYEDATRELSVNLYADLQPYTPYLLIFEKLGDNDEYNDNDDEEAMSHAEKFASLLGSDCILDTEFYVDASTVLRSNGEIVDPTIGVCVGGTIEITPETRYTVLDEEGNVKTSDDGTIQKATIAGMVYDWYYGTVDEFTAKNTDGRSVQSALAAFRTSNPQDEELPSSYSENETFTEKDYKVLKKLVDEERLFLAMSSLPVTMPESGIRLVIVPVVASATLPEDVNYEVCLSYVPLVLMPTAQAPTVYPGFTDVSYPYDAYPNVRVGKHQIETATSLTTNYVPITINLREAGYSFDDSSGLTNTSEYPYLFLIDSDDPAWIERLHDETFTNTQYPIGYIDDLSVYTSDDDSQIGTHGNNTLTVHFAGENGTGQMSYLNAKEGYSYTCLVYFVELYSAEQTGIAEEKNDWIEDTNDYTTMSCIGTMPITFKVVPEYVVWNGTETDNWNNDSHWTRADLSDLAGTDTSGSGSGSDSTTDNPYTDYTTNDANTTSNGFVPMLFTNVVVPAGKNVELYPASFAASTTEENMKEWTGDEASESVYSDETMDLAEHPTENIMYDMMVYGGELEMYGAQLSSRKKVGLNDQTSYDITSMQTQPYRTNVCNDIHLASGAQILHSELLLANTVWTDVAIPQNQWTLVASPLTGIVAGDWYTDTSTGSQATLPLFTDITFSSDVNDRYSPAVYQRSWETSGKIIANSSDDNRSVPAYETTGWTSAYNDAYVSYQPGEGYSIKGGYGDAATTDSLVFRFPKSDTDYTYGSSSSNTTTHDQGQLAIFSMVDREDPDDDYSSSATGKITVNLSQESATNYYIVGNPFTAYMSMKEFMDENKQFDAYWLPENGSTGGPVAGNSGDNNSWHVTSDGSDNVYVKPYSAFFVRVDDNYTGTGDKYTVTFTPEMQTMTLPADVTPLQFSIRASSAQGTSSASIAYSDNAANDYVLGEDVLLLTDNSWNHSQPMVYSVAGSNAVAVNMVADLYQIPLGVFATDDSDYTLTFVGVDKLDTPSLYDADELTDTPLTEGYTLTLNGSTHGRYFLRAQGAPEGISDISADDDNVTIYSPTPHTLVITATSEIMSIEVYSLNGTILAKATPASLSCTLSGLPTGVALIRTTTANTTTTKKLYVR